MPAIDICEPAILRALQKDGWVIVNKPQSIRLPTRTFYADVSLSRGHNGSHESIVIVEIKCFSNPEHDLQEFYTVIGQYTVYRTALSLAGSPSTVYLGIPLPAFQRLSTEPVTKTVLGNVGVKLVVVDIEAEEVILWIH